MNILSLDGSDQPLSSIAYHLRWRTKCLPVLKFVLIEDGEKVILMNRLAIDLKSCIDEASIFQEKTTSLHQGSNQAHCLHSLCVL